MTTKTHYRKLINPDYMGAYSLDNGNNGYNEIDATLKYVKQEDVPNPQGKKEPRLVGYTDQPKPFILNRGSQKLISRLAKSRYVEDWVNIPITFYVEENLKAFGELTDALRIKNRVQRQQVDYSKQSASLRACTTLDQLKVAYSALNKAEQAATVAVKDEMKVKLTPKQ